MAVIDAYDEIEAAPSETLALSGLAGMDSIERLAWIIYVFIFAVLPFVVVFFRTDMLAVHYYVAGAFFLGGALALCAINLLE